MRAWSGWWVIAACAVVVVTATSPKTSDWAVDVADDPSTSSISDWENYAIVDSLGEATTDSSTSSPTDSSTSSPTKSSTSSPTGSSTSSPTKSSTSPTIPSSVSPTTPSTTTTTQPPNKDLFVDTGTALANITSSLDELEKKLDPTPSAPKRSSDSFHIPIIHALRTSKHRDVLGPKDTISICVARDGAACPKVQSALNNIEVLTDTLKNDVDTWQWANLNALQLERDNLNEGVSLTTESDTSYDPGAKAIIEDVKKNVEEGQQVAADKVAKFEQDETASVVFTAVMGAVGGVMVVALLGSIGYFAYKKSSGTKKAKKAYKKINEEIIPIQDFASTPQHTSPPPPADPYAKPPADRDPYARDPYAGGYGTRGGHGGSRDSPVKKSDPYGRPGGDREPPIKENDPYGRPGGTQPRRDNNYRSPFATGNSRGLPRNYEQYN